MTPPLDTRRRRDRSRSRAWFLQVHYRWEAEGGAIGLEDALAETLEQRLVSPRRIRYLERLVRNFGDNRHRIDDAISDAMDNWRLGRLPLMDRGVLRLGATELLCLKSIPGKVAIQESVRLAERYGGAESSRFVNGVLDAVFRASRADRAPGFPRRG